VQFITSGVSKGDKLADVVSEEAVVEEFRLLSDARNQPSGPCSGNILCAFLGAIGRLFYILFLRPCILHMYIGVHFVDIFKAVMLCSCPISFCF